MRRIDGALAAVALLLVTACGQQGPPSSSAGDQVSGSVTVFAASSLTGAFTRLGRDFEAAHPGVRVTFNFAGSSALAQQLGRGAPADVFAPAAPDHLGQVTGGIPVVFARNRLAIAVPKGNPAGISGLADLADPDRKIALCAPQVPCGAAAKKALDAAGVTARPDTLEQDVKGALGKVRLGEVDAALVYRTDVRAAAGAVEGIEFPTSERAVNDYPIITLLQAPNPGAGKAFVAFVLSAAGRAVLTEAGFEAP